VNPAVFSLLCALPFALVFAFRYIRLSPRIDARARRSLLGKMGGFLFATAVTTASLYAGRGRFSLPLAWVLALIVLAVTWLLGLLKRA
jgi:hypothetical protein